MSFISAETKLRKIIPVAVDVRQEQIGKYQIRYAVAGSGPPLLLLHGLNMGWGQWYPNIAELAQVATVYALDLPGCGGSEPISFLTDPVEDIFLEAVEEFLAHKKIRRAVILGHSISGWLAVKLALRQPKAFRGLILEDPLGLTNFITWRFRPLASLALARFLAATVMRPTRRHIEHFIRSVLAPGARVAPEFVDYFVQSLDFEGKTHPFFLIHRLFGSWTQIRSRFVLRRKYRELSLPVLLMTGEQDPLLPASQICRRAKAIPRTKIVVISGSGHVPNMEKSIEFNQAVLQFLVMHTS